MNVNELKTLAESRGYKAQISNNKCWIKTMLFIGKFHWVLFEPETDLGD